jgi:LemA protein
MAKRNVILLGCFGLIVLGILIIGLWYVRSYNTMVNKSEGIDGAWSTVETQYQRRADLIPNLVAVVKGYADFEQETLTQVIEARSKATSINLSAGDINAENLQKFQQAQDQLSGALSRLLVTVERYPNLKANENFLDLQTQLERTESRIQRAREQFVEMVKSYNTYIKRIPNNLIAGFAGFSEKPYFGAVEGSDVTPDVNKMMKEE